MSFIKVLLCMLVLYIVPELIGLLILKKTDYKNNIFCALLVGYIYEFAFFEIIYLIFFFCNGTFRDFQYVWNILLGIITIISIIINRNELKNIFVTTKKILYKLPKYTLVLILLILIQIYIPFRYMQHVDSDDAYYVAVSTTTINEDSLLKVNQYTGEENKEIQWRYCFAGLAIYYAVISENIHIHTAIFQHTIWPIVIIMLEWIVYALIANKIYMGNKEKTIIFMIFLALTYIFGYTSIYANFSFFAYRSWQGKTIIANLIIPLIWVWYDRCIDKKNSNIDWLIFECIMISSCFVTELGVFLIPVEVAILTLIDFIQKRKLKNILKFSICCIPQILIGITYMIFK